MKSRRLWFLLLLVVPFLIWAGITLRAPACQTFPLPDGNILGVEAVTYGTQHHVGAKDAWLTSLRRHLPAGLIKFLEPERGPSSIRTERDALVVWLHLQDPVTGKYLDCQGLRAEFIDENGDLYPPANSSHASFSSFNRIGHVFEVFPRRGTNLVLQLTPWNPRTTKPPARVELISPYPNRRPLPDWQPEDYPITKRSGGLEFTLESLAPRVLGSEERPWETPSRHWEPKFRLTQNGEQIEDWENPSWQAEDLTGNRGHTLALHEPVLKFTAIAYPKVNSFAPESSLFRAPNLSADHLHAGVTWTTNKTVSGANVTILGLVPPGAYTFTNGNFAATPPGMMSGPPGWISMSPAQSPGKPQQWHTHRTTNHTAYIVVRDRSPGIRIAARLQNTQGETLIGLLEPQGPRGDVIPFSFALPQHWQGGQLEILTLRPAQVEFIVKPPST